MAGTVGYRFTDHVSFESDITWIDAAAGGFRNQRLDFDPRVSANTTINTVLQRTVQMFGGRNQLPNFNTPIGTIVPQPINIGNLSASTGGNTWIGTMGVRYEPTTQTDRFRPYVSSGIGINYTTQQFTLDSTSISRMVDESISNSGLAFGVGGGANIRLAGSLWATADAKYFRLSRERDLMRIGGGVTLKF
jgi:opacity protein-like surface antigen